MKKIIIIKNDIEQVVKYSDRDHKLIRKLNIRITVDGYAIAQWEREQYKLHQIIKFNEIRRGFYIDHINGDRLDNRRCNLRLCTPSQNAMNRKIPSTNTSGYKGVSLVQYNNKWLAQIVVQGKTIRLGVFENKNDAIEARLKAEVEIFKNYRRK